jgi:hypothetical protein
MASKVFERDVGHVDELFDVPLAATWSFADRLKDLTATSRRDTLLAALNQGHNVKI